MDLLKELMALSWKQYTNEMLQDARLSSLVESPSRSMEKEMKRRWLLEKDDSTAIPDETLNKIKSNIRKGAKDTTQLWANALELVHTAYDVTQVQRPDITMQAAWKQYEEMIQCACEELAKARGIDGKWRMSSVTNEAMEEECEYSLESDVGGLPVNVVKKSNNIEALIKPFFDHNMTGHDIEMRHRSPHNVCLYFCKNGKRTGHKVTIRKVKK